MASEQTLVQKLQPHVGGLVRVRCDDGRASGLNGKIGLLMSVTACKAPWLSRAVVELLIDGSVRSLFLYPDELELIGADDAK